MKEFDGLLEDVLREDARVEVPIGIERRIAAALSSERKRALSNRRIWLQAVAATILLGLTGVWAINRSKRVVYVAPEASSVVAPKPTDNSIRPPSPSQDSYGSVFVQVSTPGRCPGRHLQRKALRLAPLRVEPLFIKPIEIASLTSSTSTTKGEVR